MLLENHICSFLLSPSISPKRIKLENYNWAEKKHLEILISDVIIFYKILMLEKCSKSKIKSMAFIFNSRGTAEPAFSRLQGNN